MQNHILLVEDDNDINTLVSRYLKANDCRVSVARDGREMDRILSTSRVDIVLLDIMLPDKDGFEVCRLLRANQAFSSTPIIMLTARTLPAERDLGMRLGAASYVTKPFSTKVLVQEIEKALS